MKPKNPFVISQFTNPSGEVVFRVSGWLDGKRVRKNFPTRPEAEAERQVLEIQRLQGETGIRPAVTRLTEDQLHEAEVVFGRVFVVDVQTRFNCFRRWAGEAKINVRELGEFASAPRLMDPRARRRRLSKVPSRAWRSSP